MSQQHAERCQYDVVTVISDANGPAVQNVTVPIVKTPIMLQSSSKDASQSHSHMSMFALL